MYSGQCLLIFSLGTSLGFALAYSFFLWELRYDTFIGLDNNLMRDEYVIPDYEISNNTIAERISNTLRILCWITTSPSNFFMVESIRKTWGRRCDILLFMSSKQDASKDVVRLPVHEGKPFLWSKTKESLTYIYKNYLDRAEWFLKTDDDTYIVMENLKYLLSDKNSSKPVYYGCRFKRDNKLTRLFHGYMYGGPGYVLSKEALIRFVEKGLPDPKVCNTNSEGLEDVEIARSMIALNVTMGDTRDSIGRATFLPGILNEHLMKELPPKITWFWNKMMYGSSRGMECCSSNAISFHKVDNLTMMNLEYLIYSFRAYGLRTILYNK